MAFTAADELTVRRHLAARAANVTSAGYVIPSARYHSGIEDYIASAKPAEDTQLEIDTHLVGATWIYPVSFEDDTTLGICKDKPLIRVTYEFYVFRQYGMERLDETATPDVFDSKVIKQETLFNEAWWGLKEEFQRDVTISELSGFATAKTTALTMPEDAWTQAVCEFIPGIVGYALRLRSVIEIKEA